MSLPVPIRGIPGLIIFKLLLGAACALPVLTAPVAAQVRFGSGVRIGGHDFSHRRYGSVHVERVRRLPGPPGCRHLRHGTYRRGDGSVVRGPMEQCNLIAIPPGRR
ncbi:hypothetical protein [Methylobacterium sp. E-045]|uniref:hypothetical protein n=1 Tax=Methylobacterium sp. E-045 TaxID=2836575 RepID=UPI001FBA4A48|nr:hypothetical protein [Methylobacterium sp. E-045]MCJ2132323.1 hypothetical protein [Methylobacterium sp. E-045]